MSLKVTTANPPPTALGARIVSYLLGAYKVLWKGWPCYLWMASLDWKSRVLVLFLRFKEIEGHVAPPFHGLFFPKASDRNFERAICKQWTTCNKW